MDGNMRRRRSLQSRDSVPRDVRLQKGAEVSRRAWSLFGTVNMPSQQADYVHSKALLVTSLAPSSSSDRAQLPLTLVAITEQFVRAQGAGRERMGR